MEMGMDALAGSRREYAELVESARLARQQYDERMLDPNCSDDALADAAEAAAEAERARDRIARVMRKAARGTATDRTPWRAPKTAGYATPRARRRSDVDGTQQEIVSDTLNTVAVPCRGPDLSAFVYARTGRKLSPAQLIQMRREGQRQYDNAAGKPELLRPWYVVPCLSAETLSPASGTYSLSTWPDADRLVSPYSPRLWAARGASNVASALVRRHPEMPALLFAEIDQQLRNSEGIANDTTTDSSTTSVALLQILMRLLRGNEWGRDGLRVDLARAASDADHEATQLVDLHHQATRGALTRLVNLAPRTPAIRLWGKPRTDTVRAEEGQA
jgi:hypothetical protein